MPDISRSARLSLVRLCGHLVASDADTHRFFSLVLQAQTLALSNSIPILAAFTACDTAQCAPVETMRANAVLLAKRSYEPCRVISPLAESYIALRGSF